MRTSELLVLVVLDDAALRAVIVQSLILRGCRVTSCGSDARAVAAPLVSECDWLVADEALVESGGLPMPSPPRTILIVPDEVLGAINPDGPIRIDRRGAAATVARLIPRPAEDGPIPK